MRQWLIDKRKARGLTRARMASKCLCSIRLLEILELEDGITHPGIAAWVAQEYRLTLDEYNLLVHETKRAKAIPAAEAPPTLKDFFASKYAREYRYKNK